MITATLQHLHVIRTAGQRIRGIIRESGTTIVDDRAHQPLTHAPDRWTFVVVRNPWDWYLSRWAFLQQRHVDGPRHPLHCVTFSEHMGLVMRAYAERAPLQIDTTDYWRETLTGWHNWTCGNQLEPQGVDVLHFERLAEQLPPLLAPRICSPLAWVTERMADRINSTTHGDRHGMFAPEAAEWVGWVDRGYCERFGYAY